MLISGYSISQLAIAIVIIAAICALVFIALRQFGIAIPAWVQSVFWVVVCACVVVLAIRFVAGG